MIHRQNSGEVAVLRMEHGKANAIDVDLFDELDECLDEIESSSATGAVVLTGTGAMFSAGVDLYRVIEGGRDYLEAFLPRISSSLTRVFNFPRPVVAGVNGHAIAGGFILALACDHRVMAEGRGKLGLTELLVGVPFPVAALEIVRYVAPGRIVQDLVLTGRTMPGAEALELRLVDEVTPADSLIERAVEVARRYAAIPREAYVASQRHLHAPAMELIGRYSARFDPEALEMWSNPESLERIARFLEKTVGKKG